MQIEPPLGLCYWSILDKNKMIMPLHTTILTGNRYLFSDPPLKPISGLQTINKQPILFIKKRRKKTPYLVISQQQLLY